MQRITKAHVEAKIDTLNTMLGVEAGQVGSVELYGAYGSTAVHQIMNEYRGMTDLHPLGTLREAAVFLSGMIAALRLTQGSH